MSMRIKAFLIHGLVSISVALLVIGLVFFIWYPSPLAKAVGVTHIFLMMLVIDVILGPLLTLLVYKQGKKTLLFDLTVIVLLQISALGYGLWTISQGRPAWLVFNVDRFDNVRVNEIDNRNIAKAQQQYQNPSWFYPQWVAATSPKNVEENNKVTSFQEKPKGDGHWINAGFFVCEPKVFDYIVDGDSTVFEQEPLMNLAKDGEIFTYKHNGFWLPMDTLRDKIKLNELWDENKAPWKVWDK